MTVLPRWAKMGCRIRGQVGAVERALESEVGCEKVMHLLASTWAATWASRPRWSRTTSGPTSWMPSCIRAR